MKTYLVGGAVRDGLLDIPFTERDWVVTGATEQDMLDAGYRRADPAAAFPVFLHPETGEEYALARRETKTGAGYKGFAVEAGPDVSLEEDLARRDLTINAMAQDGDGQLIDPFDGRKDLDAGLLRHVTPAFVEDPVRLLRIARFAAKLGVHGFHVAHTTHALLKRMAVDEDLAALKPERVWKELRRALAEQQPWRFVEVLQRCGALAVLMPELAAGLADQAGHGSRHTSPPITALQQAAAAELTPPWRLACLLAALDGDVDALLARLRVDKAYTQPVQLLRKLLPAYRTLPNAEAASWLGFFEQGRALQLPAVFDQLVKACGIAVPATGSSLTARIATARQAVMAVSTQAIQATGVQGAALGEALRAARLAAVSQALAGASEDRL